MKNLTQLVLTIFAAATVVACSTGGPVSGSDGVTGDTSPNQGDAGLDGSGKTDGVQSTDADTAGGDDGGSENKDSDATGGDSGSTDFSCPRAALGEPATNNTKVLITWTDGNAVEHNDWDCTDPTTALWLPLLPAKSCKEAGIDHCWINQEPMCQEDYCGPELVILPSTFDPLNSNDELFGNKGYWKNPPKGFAFRLRIALVTNLPVIGALVGCTADKCTWNGPIDVEQKNFVQGTIEKITKDVTGKKYLRLNRKLVDAETEEQYPGKGSTWLKRQ